MVSSFFKTALLVATALGSVSAAPVNEKRANDGAFWSSIVSEFGITLPTGVSIPGADPTGTAAASLASAVESAISTAAPGVTSIAGSAISSAISLASATPTSIPAGVFPTPIGTAGTAPVATGTSVPVPVNSTIPTGGNGTAPSGAQTVAYFGQSKVNGDDSLEKYCADDSIDIIVLSFLTTFIGQGGLPETNFAGYCTETISGTGLNSCPSWESTIKTCQQNGKKVILSLGGATGANHLTDDTAVTFADNLWKLFGEGTGMESQRPFGTATVDGFDLDIENQDPNGYPKLISEMRTHFQGASKSYVMSGAPQCPRPDASLENAVYDLDYIFIQFYNNPSCQLDGLVDSFNSWSSDVAAKTTANTKIFIGLPGSTKAAGSGYATPEQMTQYVSQVKSAANFGGVMTWDAPYAASNTNNGQNFLQSMRAAIS